MCGCHDRKCWREGRLLEFPRVNRCFFDFKKRYRVPRLPDNWFALAAQCITVQNNSGPLFQTMCSYPICLPGPRLLDGIAHACLIHHHVATKRVPGKLASTIRCHRHIVPIIILYLEYLSCKRPRSRGKTIVKAEMGSHCMLRLEPRNIQSLPREKGTWLWLS